MKQLDELAEEYRQSAITLHTLYIEKFYDLTQEQRDAISNACIALDCKACDLNRNSFNFRKELENA